MLHRSYTTATRNASSAIGPVVGDAEMSESTETNRHAEDGNNTEDRPTAPSTGVAAVASASSYVDKTETDTIDWFEVLPSTRIHAQLQRDQGVGRLSKQAAQFIGACSALFLQELIGQAAADASTAGSDDDDDDLKTAQHMPPSTQRITLKHVRSAAKTYPFLDEVLAQVTEEGAPKVRRVAVRAADGTGDTAKRPATKRRKTKDPATVKEARGTIIVAQGEAPPTHPSRIHIEQDEDEYD